MTPIDPEELKKEFDKQKALFRKVVYDSKVNIVTCPDCGQVLLHEINSKGDLKCPHCLTEGDQCDFPDFIY